MRKFTTLTSVAAVLRESDIDTDIIFPARFLLLLDKAGLGKHLFHERRGKPGADGFPFVLSRPPFDTACILVAGANFGGGSSREQAVWALADFGIRCVIAPSFGEIFYANCFKNGVLPLTLEDAEHGVVMDAAETGDLLTVDLESEVINLPHSRAIAFTVDSSKRKALLEGMDEIGSILAEDLHDIKSFEARQRRESPWLHLDARKLSYFSDLGKETALD